MPGAGGAGDERGPLSARRPHHVRPPQEGGSGEPPEEPPGEETAEGHPADAKGAREETREVGREKNSCCSAYPVREGFEK